MLSLDDPLTTHANSIGKSLLVEPQTTASVSDDRS
jgi:hypothetical protein